MENQRLAYYGLPQMARHPQMSKNNIGDFLHELNVVANVLPFRVSNYVVEELIDWSKVPDDPLFQLTFLQKGMLTDDQFRLVESSMNDREALHQAVAKVREQLNPHPAGQLSHNVPVYDGNPVPGLQHKYRETALVFPSAGQSCFSFCTFCFRWPQFIGERELKFSTDNTKLHLDYLREHKEITDVLITGGDPMTMRARHLKMFLEPLTGPEFAHIKNVRIGTKVLSFWPYRFVTDKDADEYLRLFEKLINADKHLAFMAHINHTRELSTEAVQKAVKRIRATGANIRSQAPLLRGINDDHNVWSEMWTKQVNMGIIPYYMFVERDTGPKHYFEVPLARCYEIYRKALSNVSGLARTVRGPSMSAHPGKVCVQGVAEVNGQLAFVLNFLQGRDPNWCQRPFFAKYDETACWLDDLEPLDGERWFFEEDNLIN